MKEINLKFNITRARNAEHYQFHSDVLDIITTGFASAQKIDSLRDTYQQLFDTENECYLSNRAYKDTLDIETADKMRDDLFLYLSQTIATGKLCPIADKKSAAQTLDYVIDPYRGAPRLNYASNTAAIQDFILKIREARNSDAINALGLKEAVDALEEANKAFNALYSGRSTEVLSRATSEKMKSIRPQVDKAYKETVSAINALYEVNALITKNRDVEIQLETVIDKINAIIIQLQKTLSRAGVGAKNNLQPGDNKPGGNQESDGDKPEEL